MSNKSIDSLYFLKGVCAFLVVCCHAPMFGVFNDWISPIRMAAVPFFFVISGYFLYLEDETKQRERLKKSILKLIPLIVICNLFYLIWVFPNHGLIIQTWSQVVELILYGTSVIGHLWYLTAFLWALVFYLIASYLCKGQYRVSFLFSLLPLALLSVFGKAYAHYLAIDINVFSAIPYAIPFLAMGMLIRRYEALCLSSILSTKGFFAISIALLTIEFSIASYFSRQYVHAVLLTTLLFVPCTFIVLLKYKNSPFFSGAGKSITSIGQKYSGNIYYWHMAAITIGIKISMWLGLSPEQHECISAPLGFAIALIMSAIIVKIQDTLGWNILR